MLRFAINHITYKLKSCYFLLKEFIEICQLSITSNINYFHNEDSDTGHIGCSFKR